MSVTREAYRYDESGLPNVTLLNLEIRKCQSCGEVLPVIPRIDELHHVIARAIIEQRARLSGAEVRFLRKYLGYSGDDFAEVAGVSRETVSRWENDRDQIGAPSDRLLRLLVVQGKQVQNYDAVERFRQIKDDQRLPRFSLSRSGSNWEAQAIA